MAHPNEIQIEDENGLNDESFEIMRVWVTHNGGSPVWIRGGVVANPDVLGRVIANAILHTARAHAQATGMPEAEAVAAIRQGVVGGLDDRARLEEIKQTSGLN